MVEREISIHGEEMKFSCAHFVAYDGFRELLHGHNYTAKLRLAGRLNPQDGYILDFGVVKAALKYCCKQLNEHLIVPMKSDVLKLTRNKEQLEIITQDNSFFSLPVIDCALLPIAHSTAEEIAEYLWNQVLREIGHNKLIHRHVQWMEIHVYERPSQGAVYRAPINQDVLFNSDLPT